MSSSSYCSVFSLCVAAIATLVSVAFVGIAFSTDNWLNSTVDRDNIQEFAETTSGNKNLMWKLRLKSDIRYFDRVRGIFRVCFPHEVKPEPRRVPNDVPPPPLNILIQQETAAVSLPAQHHQVQNPLDVAIKEIIEVDPVELELASQVTRFADKLRALRQQQCEATKGVITVVEFLVVSGEIQ